MALVQRVGDPAGRPLALSSPGIDQPDRVERESGRTVRGGAGVVDECVDTAGAVPVIHFVSADRAVCNSAATCEMGRPCPRTCCDRALSSEDDE